MSRSLLVIPIGALLALLTPGCPGVADPSATLPTPFLPSTSNIPTDIYTGTLDITATVREDGAPSTVMQSIPFTIVIDQDGRFLDANGVPFMIDNVYYVDANPLSLTLFSRSITVSNTQILLRFDLTAVGDLGEIMGEFSGSQTDTLIYHDDTNTIEFIRSQLYGGLDSNDVAINFVVAGHATLSPN